jgi:hypothetical protein
MNRENVFILGLLKQMRGSGVERPIIAQLEEYFKSVKVDANFSSLSLSIGQWNDVVDYPDMLQTTRTRLMTDNPKFKEMPEIRINFEKMLGFNLDKSINQSIHDIVSMVNKMKIYQRAIDGLSTLTPVDSETIVNNDITKNASLFESMLSIVTNQNQLTEYILSHTK